MAKFRSLPKGERLSDEAAPNTQWDPDRSPVEKNAREDIGDAPRETPAAKERQDPIPRPEAERPAKPEVERPREPAQKPDEGADEKKPAKKGPGFLRRHPVATVLGLILVLAVAAAGYVYWDNSSHFESTDDAFVAARQYSVAPQVSGYVVAVPVTDNEHVAKGDLIARIDPRNYDVALEQAEAQVAAADAGIKTSDAQIAAQEAQIVSNQAQVAQAQAALVFAQQQSARYQALAKTGAGTVENAQQYTSQQNQQQAALDSAQATLRLAQRQVSTLEAQRANAVASLKQAEAQRRQAQLNLSYTYVTADQPGRVANLSASIGEYATAGTALAMFVPDDIWVSANFKETELDRMRPDQPVTMSVDAYPEREFHGHVASIQPGSGTAFSLLPAENATGNYVKIVQRVPVKLLFDDIPRDVTLGPGMSVVPSVRVDPSPSIWEGWKARYPWLSRLPL